MTAPTLHPTGVYRTWFPAVVRLPDGQQLTKAKVYATDAGLVVYALAAPGAALTGVGAGLGVRLAFESPILLDKTAAPGTDYASEQRGHIIMTEVGPVSVVRGGACTCSMRALKGWSPPWASIEKTWGE